MDSLEAHIDAFNSGDKVLIIDDLLATGGTAKAAAELVELANAEVVSFLFLIKLSDLKGGDVLKDYQVESLITY